MRYNQMLRFHDMDLFTGWWLVSEISETMQGQSMRKMRVLGCFDRKMSLRCSAL